jgi:hypothetical protein
MDRGIYLEGKGCAQPSTSAAQLPKVSRQTQSRDRREWWLNFQATAPWQSRLDWDAGAV